MATRPERQLAELPTLGFGDGARTKTFGIKLGIHNTITKVTTFGRSKWVIRSDIRNVLDESTSFRVGASTVHKTGDSFVIGGRESFGYFNRATSHHEMMHIGQYIRNPNLIDTRPIGYIHELIPAFVGTPELYGGGTIIVVGGTRLVGLRPVHKLISRQAMVISVSVTTGETAGRFYDLTAAEVGCQ